MKRLYFTTWIVLAAVALGSILAGTFNELTLVTVAFVALALVYGFALWVTIKNTREPATDSAVGQ